VHYRIEQVRADDTWELRQKVLRPHETILQLALPDDDRPSTGTFAAIGEDGEIIGSVRVAPDPPPLATDPLPFEPLATDPPPFETDASSGDDSSTWRLRGMATREDARNQGIGTALLDRAIRHVALHGGGLLWCNARVPALNLYRRAGFVEEGDRWDDPDIGPHVVMWRSVDRADPA
jgi:GNAT superfamily N-acetyltransferase